MLNYNEIKESAKGKWIGIYQALGVRVGDGKHGPCPVCGGKDRFRCDDKDGNGTWICNQCGAGDGWSLIQKVLQCDFKEAVEQIAPLLGKINPGTIKKESFISPEILRKIFLDSVPGTKENLVGQYLRGRGLKIIPPVLRYIPECHDPETRRDHPAMLGIVTMPDGKAVTMHRTYLDPVTAGKARMKKSKKTMPGTKKMTGGAIRLYPDNDGIIGIAEGIETALACAELFDIPTWAAISAPMLEGFIPPKNIKEVFIYGDNDLSFTGQKAAYALANRLVLVEKKRVFVSIPRKEGDDFLDELVKK